MKRYCIPVLLCTAALLVTGCTAATGTPEISTQPAETVESTAAPATAETPAPETQAPEPIPAANTSEEPIGTSPAYTLSDAERKLRENEEQARRELDAEKIAANFDEKKAAILASDGIVVEGAESWQDGFAQLLKSGDAVYLGKSAPTADCTLLYSLLHVEDSDIPALAVDSCPSGGSVDESVLFFRWEDGTVRYIDCCYIDNKASTFHYRPYRGDIGYLSGSTMGEGVFINFKHLGSEDETFHNYLETGFGPAEHPLTEEMAKEYGLEFDAENGTGRFDDTWVKAAPEFDFREVTPDTIAQLYHEE